MNNPPPADTQSSRANQADYWLTLLHSPLFDAKQQRALRQWLAAHPDNLAALQKSLGFWQKMGTLDTTQIALLEQRLAHSAPKKTTQAPLSKSLWLIPALASLLLLASPALQFLAIYFADFRTAVGEQRSIELSDGSRVFLNTDTALSVDFTAQRRNIILYSGEAHFKVAKDKARPFDVTTDSGTVRALGTAFDVRQLDGDMTITVTEHAVKIILANGETLARLAEGERVSVNKHHSNPIEKINIKQAEAWQQQRLVFKDQALQHVLAELSRYRGGKILITDNALAQHHVTGTFDTTDTEIALKTIEKNLGLQELRLTDRLILLSKY